MSTRLAESALTAPRAEVGHRLLAIAEDQWFDRKSIRASAQGLANALVGMANADGGLIVVGLSEGTVEGVDAHASKKNDLMQANIDYCRPPVRAAHCVVECINSSGSPDHLLVFDVDPSEQVHTNQRDEVYLRIGDENRQLTFQQRQELLFDKGQATYEARPLMGTSEDDLDRDLVAQYAAALGHPDGDRLLKARGLCTSSGELTVAGCLLFAENPQQHVPESYVRVLRYRGTARGTGSRQQLLHDEKIEGAIPRQLLRARDAIRPLVPTRKALLASGVFGDQPLIPEDAWLEGVVNAVVHRSYSLAGDHIRVEVFDDRLEVSSPGRFPGLVSPGDPLNAPRFARNPRIARVCADLNFGQELGEGIRRIFDEMRAAGLVDPIYRQTSGSVVLTLSTELADRALDARLPANSRRIVTVLRDAGRLSTGEIVELTGLSRPATLRRLNALRDAGLVDWHGNSPKDPRAYWSIARASDSS